jgi:hypothetical protein
LLFVKYNALIAQKYQNNYSMKRIELFANIALTAVGLLLGIVFYLNSHKELSLVLFSIALASILYQFLGGIGDGNSFQLGAIKFGGSTAVLMGFMFFFKNVVYVPVPEEYNLDVKPDRGWIPVDIRTGEVSPVKITNNLQSKSYPLNETYKEERKKHNYQLSESGSNRYSIQLTRNLSDTIGYVHLNGFKTRNLYNKITNSPEPRVQVFKLYPEDETRNSTAKLKNVKLPFEIKVSGAWFSIPGYGIGGEEVVPRTSWVVPYSDNFCYIVFLEQANSMDDEIENYSKWLVKKFCHKLE